MEQLKGKQTPGVAIVKPYDRKIEGEFASLIEVKSEDVSTIILTATAFVWHDDKSEGHMNAALYCEAHNVANESGMWPREMQERIKMLEEALTKISECCPVFNGDRREFDTPSDFSNPEDYARYQQALNDDMIGNIARTALTTPSTIN